MSKGRAGWNIVTTSTESEAQNFGSDRHMAHDERYARAEEFVDVVRGLWDSWRDEDLLRDKASGLYFRPDGLRMLNHKGKYFSVRGPLDVIRTPQGHPVLVQAGSSDPGRNLAARVADVVFTTHQTLAAAQDFYNDVRARARGFGRSPDELAVLIALMPVVAETEEQAWAKFERVQALIHPSQSLPLLSASLGGIDLSLYARDEPLPADLPAGNAMTSRRRSILELAKRENLTLLQLAVRVAGTRGHWVVAGTPKTIADRMEEWFLGRGTDGFLLVPATLPGGLADFIREVVPELQRRSLFRSAYEGGTMRENLGLPFKNRQLAELAG